MAGELYRTYEVLIEESIHPEHPKRAKSGKDDRYGDGKVHEALLTTNEMFQDAVCYYTIMLAGMCRDESKNPIWRCWLTDKKVSQDMKSVVARLSSNYPHAIFHGAVDVNDFLEKAYSYRGTDIAGLEKQRRTAAPAAAQLEETLFTNIKPQMVKTNDKTGEEECQNLMKAANDVRGPLCNPCGETNLEGMGGYDCLHREIRDWIEGVQAGSEWLRLLHKQSEAKKKADKESLKVQILGVRKAVFEDMNLFERVKERVLEIAKERTVQIHALVERKVKTALPEGNTEGEEEVKKLIQKEIAKARQETKKGPYTGLFVGLPADSSLSDFAKEAEKEIVKTSDGDARFCRLQETTRKGIKRDDNAFSKPLYRLLWFLKSSTSDEAKWKAAAKDVLVYAAETKPKRAAGTLMPFQSEPQEPLFPFFTNCLGQPLPDGQQSLWGEFEQAALATAADDVFKYKIKTDRRARQVQRLRSLMQQVEEKTGVEVLEKENSPLGRKITARGMAKMSDGKATRRKTKVLLP